MAWQCLVPQKKINFYGFGLGWYVGMSWAWSSDSIHLTDIELYGLGHHSAKAGFEPGSPWARSNKLDCSAMGPANILGNVNVSFYLQISYVLLLSHDCCVFRAAFGCCAHPKAGRNTQQTSVSMPPPCHFYSIPVFPIYRILYSISIESILNI